jgi:hypothetical protein
MQRKGKYASKLDDSGEKKEIINEKKTKRG